MIMADKHSNNTSDDNNGNIAATNYDESFINAIHSSHFVKAVNSHSNAVFCHRCGAYNDGGPLRLLRNICKWEVTPSRQNWHRLLTAGIVPGPGVKLPSNLKNTL